MSRNPTAAEVFTARADRATVMAIAIGAHMHHGMGINPEAVNWGHAGSAGRAVELLEELSKFLGLELPGLELPA